MDPPLPPDTPYHRELSIAHGLTRLASKLSIHPVPLSSMAKDDLSPVTVVDIAIQAFLTCSLRREFPSDAFVGEESAQQLREDRALLDSVWGFVKEMELRCGGLVGGEAACFPRDEEEVCELLDLGGLNPGSAQGRVWILDPVDGTKAFVQGKVFAVNVALMDQGMEQMVCVVACPRLDFGRVARGEQVDDWSLGDGGMVFAVKGQGAFAQEFVTGDERGEMLPARRLGRMQVGQPLDPSQLSWVDSPSMPSPEVIQEVRRETARVLGGDDAAGEGFRSCDIYSTVLRWALLALGGANAWVHVWNRRDRHGWLWDYAGPMLLYEEVGGKITDVEGRAIDLSRGRKIDGNGSVICGPQEVHGDILKAARAALVKMGRHDLLDTQEVREAGNNWWQLSRHGRGTENPDGSFSFPIFN
jgi:3'(2'), 5'-bisphosphate nucleotidase